MNDLNRALGEIRDIRRQLANTTEFRGYGPLTLCATGGFALIGGLAQSVFIRVPARHPLQYVAIWSSTAIFSAALIAIQTATRAHRLHSGLADDMIRSAVEQFLPAVIAGSLLTAIIVTERQTLVWLLPALWQLVYSLGVFASARSLPRTMPAAGAWYLLTAMVSLSLSDTRTLSPWVMAGSYAIGQTLIAAILFIAAKEVPHEA